MENANRLDVLTPWREWNETMVVSGTCRRRFELFASPTSVICQVVDSYTASVALACSQYSELTCASLTWTFFFACPRNCETSLRLRAPDSPAYFILPPHRHVFTTLWKYYFCCTGRHQLVGQILRNGTDVTLKRPDGAAISCLCRLQECSTSVLLTASDPVQQSTATGHGSANVHDGESETCTWDTQISLVAHLPTPLLLQPPHAVGFPPRCV